MYHIYVTARQIRNTDKNHPHDRDLSDQIDDHQLKFFLNIFGLIWIGIDRKPSHTTCSTHNARYIPEALVGSEVERVDEGVTRISGSMNMTR